MKKSIIIAVLLFLSVLLFAQYEPWLWARQAGEETSDYGYSVSVDSNGNSYVFGYFKGIINYGNITIISRGYTDIFVAKKTAMDHCNGLSRQGEEENHLVLLARVSW